LTTFWLGVLLGVDLLGAVRQGCVIYDFNYEPYSSLLKVSNNNKIKLIRKTLYLMKWYANTAKNACPSELNVGSGTGWPAGPPGTDRCAPPKIRFLRP